MADNASITILRNTKANIDAEPIKDGNILFTTDQAENKIYTDVGTERIKIGGTVDVDTELSTTSTNPVQNKVITERINSIQSVDVDTELSTTSTNPVQNKVITERINSIQSQVVPMFNNAGAHNAIYRGKNLGTSVTTAQYNAIKAGTFDDLYIGDYWVINGVTWRIADFDYFLNCGDSSCTTHHAVIVPDTCLYNHVMNDSNVATGGYVGSKMYTEGLEQAKTTIKAAFSGHVLKHRELLVNATVGGKPSGWAWFDSEVELMNEVMVYGSVAWGAHDGNGYNVASGNGQFHLFSHDHSRAHNRNNWWLRDVVSAAHFAGVNGNGYADYLGAGYSLGVRPAFCIS